MAALHTMDLVSGTSLCQSHDQKCRALQSSEKTDGVLSRVSNPVDHDLVRTKIIVRVASRNKVLGGPKTSIVIGLFFCL